MANIKVNMVGAGLTVPVGRYTVKLTEIEEMPSQDVEKFPYLQSTLEIFGHKNKNLNGRTLIKIFSFSPKALFALRQFLTVNGFNQEQMDNPDFEFDTDSLIGKEYTVDVEINDAGYNSINFIGIVKKAKQSNI
jgi:hypothetical protein